MKTTEITSYISQHVYGAGRTWIAANPTTVRMGLAVAASFSILALIYRKLHQSDVLPFDHWKVTLGLVSRPQIAVQTDSLSDLITRYSPTELASYLFAYLTTANKPDALSADPSTPKEWLEWIAVKKRDELLPLVHAISPAYQEKYQLSAEDVSSLTIQTWTTSVQQWVSLLGWNTLSMTDSIFQSIRSSPRLAYTILFHFTAPFVAQKIRESIADPLPESLVRLKDFYTNHRISIAFCSLSLVGLLFYKMKQEKGILKNLTKIWATFQRGHKRFDLIDSYREAMDQMLLTIGKFTPSERGSNLIWFYQKKAHQTFGEEIGEALAELTAAGNAQNNALTPIEARRLSNLKVFELNLEEFLTEHEDAIHQGWNETMKHVAEAGNVIVVLKGLSVIAPHMFPVEQQSHERGGGPRDSSENPSKTLATLVTLSLHQGKFRCLMVLDEQEKNRLKQEFDFLFTKVKAPDMTSEELEEMCIRLYSAPEVGQSLPPTDIRKLFRRLKPVLDVTLFSPSDIMFAIRDAQRTWELGWQRDKATKNIEQAENQLHEAELIKKQILQKLWELRRTGQEEPLALLQATLIVEKILIHLYSDAIVALKKTLPSSEQVLVDALQKQFGRFFGACTPAEAERLQDLPRLLKNKIKGQDLAIEAIGEAVKCWRTVPPLDGRPLVLFFAGPSGAGKSQTTTELAYQLNSIYGIAESAVRTQENNIKRFYLNRDKPGEFLGWDIIKIQILEFIHENPTCVILLEEWDKCPDNEKSSLLELLEGTPGYIEGVYTQNRDRPFVEKRCVTFVITANTAGDVLAKPAEGDEKTVFIQDTNMLRKKIFDSFPENKKGEANAFLSRLYGIIPFRGISQAAGTSLADSYLEKYLAQGLLQREQIAEVKTKIPPNLQDVRELQRAVENAIYSVIRKK